MTWYNQSRIANLPRYNQLDSRDIKNKMFTVTTYAMNFVIKNWWVYKKLNFTFYTYLCYFKHGVQSNQGIPAIRRAVLQSGFLSIYRHILLWPIWFGVLFLLHLRMTRYNQTRVANLPRYNQLDSRDIGKKMFTVRSHGMNFVKKNLRV